MGKKLKKKKEIIWINMIGKIIRERLRSILGRITIGENIVIAGFSGAAAIHRRTLQRS
ncbi:hypothetical protein J2T12_004808 [Paenibacillus anaericanus]|uniref:hypothetical protein n=1 Tax=Paenibacillus anaericanus TaxID=170367 RepID=UPI0027805848|nr:hypothetical protein [Paenibacillus anaericanus]MDQ0091371.1 hypothetical protein [Paenibacillus anaericanus]